MVEQHREDGAIPLTLLCLRPRGIKKRSKSEERAASLRRMVTMALQSRKFTKSLIINLVFI
jgi:hypothetical protein